MLWLALGVAAGVALLIGLNALLARHGEPVRLADLAAVERCLRTDLLDFEAAEDGVIAADGRSALLLAADGRSVGLVLVVGDRFVTRRLRPGSLAAVHAEPAGPSGGAALRLRLNEAASPRIVIPLASASARDRWLYRLQPFAVTSRHA